MKMINKYLIHHVYKKFLYYSNMQTEKQLSTSAFINAFDAIYSNFDVSVKIYLVQNGYLF